MANIIEKKDKEIKRLEYNLKETSLKLSYLARRYSAFKNKLTCIIDEDGARNDCDRYGRLRPHIRKQHE